VAGDYSLEITANDGNNPEVSDSKPFTKSEQDILQIVEAGGGEEAVPEFTIITAIVAAVCGFGIYLLIRKRKQPAAGNK
jgi:hypothetical protein